ncbi:MAG: hypothetical protein MI919_15160 [Holophagales bacterium]|nr:hypothetical protein [Holophagales bacterium]
MRILGMAGAAGGFLISFSALLAVAAAPALAGSFASAGESLGEDLVQHPEGYDGTGGPLGLTVCLDPAAPDAAEIPLQRAILTWNRLDTAAPNLSISAGVPAGELDFRSEILRGLGLCLGLDSPADTQGYARATNGADNVFDRDPGPDTVPGTADDLRDDDGNLVWFRIADNNPFTSVPGPVDSTRYSRELGLLPEGDNFAATSTRAVALAIGSPGTEAVMVNALATGEARRSLTEDDAATLLYAASGLDELEGTADDYTAGLAYVGRATDCQIPISFTPDVSAADRVVCLGPTGSIAGNHFRRLSSDLQVSDQVSWHFDNADQALFLDGFETGTTSRWFLAQP